VTPEGTRFFRDARHDEDNTLVERYRAAGLVIFGKTHSPEFGSSPSSESALFGATHNPWDLERSAGGSSGGSAAAVAAGIVPAAHASDGGGSIRIPASACGLFGLKTSRGRVPMGPRIYEGWGGLSVQHAVSRSVRDSAQLLDAVQGEEVGDAYATVRRERPYLDEIRRAPGRLRIALMLEPAIPVPVANECTTAAQLAAKLCESLGHDVELAQPRLDVERLWAAFGLTTSVGVALKVANREAELGRPAGPDDLENINRRNVDAGRAASGIEHAQARDTLHAASRSVGRFLRNYDVILSPTMAMIPAKLGALSLSQPYEEFIGSASSASAFTGLYNMTGQPAMSVPLHWTASGLPIGVMFAGRLGDEATLFRLAAQLEAARPWFDHTPRI
jgi:amidase